jgi:hypothetical protein
MSGVKYLQQEVIDEIVLSFKEKYGEAEYERWTASLLHSYREGYAGRNRREVVWLEAGKNPHKERNKTYPRELQLEYEDEDKDIVFQYELCIYHQVKEERRLIRNEKQRERYRKNKIK